MDFSAILSDGNLTGYTSELFYLRRNLMPNLCYCNLGGKSEMYGDNIGLTSESLEDDANLAIYIVMEG